MGAITLKETHLVVDDACTDCGLCIPACPMGAIATDVATAPSTVTTPPATRYDVVSVGAGPAGSTVARMAAEAGLNVLLVEKRQEIGSPVRCAEGVGHDLLMPFIAPDRRWISAEVTGAQLKVSGSDYNETLEAEGGRGYVLERRVFDRVLAEETKELPIIESENFTFQREYLYDRVSHRIRFQAVLTIKKSGTTKKYSECLYPLIFTELRTALVGAGFSQTRFFGNESKAPYGKQSPALIAVARNIAEVK